MKTSRHLSLFLALILALSIPMAALSDSSEWVGAVIARQITFRAEPKSNSKSLGSIKNGNYFTILDNNHRGWYHIQYGGKEGYVMDAYVVENPDIMILTSSTQVYAFPHSDKRIGSLSAYTRLTIIDEYDGYYVVSLREASGFIRKRDVDALFDSDLKTARPTGRIEITEATTPRYGPANSYSATRNVSQGEVFDSYGMDGDWFIINVDGHYAYLWKGVCQAI